MSNLLTPDDVCSRLQISRKTLQRLTGGRQIGFIRVGNQVRFRETALDLYLTRRELIPKAPQRR